MLTTGTATVRIIPARAGFTEDLDDLRYLAEDHPRSRGVYTAEIVRADDPDGSSPLARGLRRRAMSPRRNRRIIPARAGFTPADAARH